MRMYRKSIFAILFVFIPFSDSKSRSNQLLKSTQYLKVFLLHIVHQPDICPFPPLHLNIHYKTWKTNTSYRKRTIYN